MSYLIWANWGLLTRPASIAAPPRPWFPPWLPPWLPKFPKLAGIPLSKYSTALSVLLKAALKAYTHFSLGNPMDMSSVIWASDWALSWLFLTSFFYYLFYSFFSTGFSTSIGFSSFFLGSGFWIMRECTWICDMTTRKSVSLMPSFSIVSSLFVVFPLKMIFWDSTGNPFSLLTFYFSTEIWGY